MPKKPLNSPCLCYPIKGSLAPWKRRLRTRSRYYSRPKIWIRVRWGQPITTRRGTMQVGNILDSVERRWGKSMQESDSLQTSVSVGKESCWRVECDELITGSLALFVLEASADFESFLTTIRTSTPTPPLRHLLQQHVALQVWLAIQDALRCSLRPRFSIRHRDLLLVLCWTHGAF